MENNEDLKVVQIGDKKEFELTTPVAIIITGVLISASILIGFYWLTGGSNSDNSDKVAKVEDTGKNNAKKTDTPTPVSNTDRILGNINAPISVILYTDFQCPFCGKFFSETEQGLNDSYIKNGKISLISRDFAFLGAESVKSAEAARCAGDQNKFWEYHDYLFTHQQGENKGAFADKNLKSFAKGLGLDTTIFNTCLDSGKYSKAIVDSTEEGGKAGVNGTPKGFIIKDGKVLDTIDGAEPLLMVTGKIDKALQ
ncbi:MAG: thioredoxin domain-containing protein [Candidatus Nomurabacteria bacterium]|nr:thioredoxin domain-containing protein [Candidatus Nomurabacteria bacterium]